MGDLLRDFHREGYAVLPDLFSASEMALMSDHVDRVLSTPSEARTLEVGTKVVRATHGNHLDDDYFAALVATPRLVGMAEDLVDDRVYVHQFKVNAKAGMVGDVWEWHQDYRFWRDEDGMPTPNALTVGIFVDEVTEFNGPLMFLQSSHDGGLIDVSSHSSGWETTLSADLKHRVDVEPLRQMMRRCPVVAPKGPPGTVVVFHSNVMHASGTNMLPDSRRMVLISYNAVGNALEHREQPRPEFLACRDFTPLAAGSDDWTTALA